jgi:hypothetical protein
MKKLIEESLNEYAGGRPASSPEERKGKVAIKILNEVKKYCTLAKTDAEETLEEFASGPSDEVDEEVATAYAVLETTISITKDILAILKNL